jgi:hypothetical protein
VGICADQEDPMNIRHGLIGGLVALITVLALGAPSASADTGGGGAVRTTQAHPGGESSEWARESIVTPAVSAGARLVDTAYIHAFGGWAWGWTSNDNDYLNGRHAKGGKWDNLDGGIVVGGRPHDRVRIHSQIGFDTDEVFLDYLFVDVTGWDSLNARAGRFSQPFGLYSEILEIGTLRPLYSLPTSVYGDSGFTALAVTGVDVLGSIDLPGDWLVKYNAYGGEAKVLEGLASLEGGAPDSIDHVAGGRLQVETPLDGLLVGVAGYWGRHQGIFVANPFDPDQEFLLGADPVDHGVLGAQLQYVTDKLEARTEYFHQWEDTNLKSDAFYVEGAYRVLDWFQLATRFDYIDIDVLLDLPPLPGFTIAPGVTKHYEWTAGLNFWIERYAVLKLNYSRIWHNRFARPEDSSLTDTSIDKKTHYITLGVQFSF